MAFFRCGGADLDIVTAQASDILSPKVIVDANGNPLTGTMTNNGSVSKSLNCGGSYTIPKGYHDGTGKVTANSLASQTSANATAARILSGYTAWANGVELTGTLEKGTVVKSGSVAGNYSNSLSLGSGLGTSFPSVFVMVSRYNVSSVSNGIFPQAILITDSVNVMAYSDGGSQKYAVNAATLTLGSSSATIAAYGKYFISGISGNQNYYDWWFVE